MTNRIFNLDNEVQVKGYLDFDTVVMPGCWQYGRV